MRATVPQPQAAPAVSGIVLEDGYVLPPPPSTGGAWRDHKTLVMTKDFALPDYCVKCDAPANGFRLKRRLSWHHPVLYLVLFVAWLIYLILAMFLRKQATVYLGLCPEHHQKRRTLLWIGCALMVLSFGATFVGMTNDYPVIWLLSLFGIFVSIVWLIIATRIVTVKKIDDRFIWLTGLNENYLARFPPIQ